MLSLVCNSLVYPWRLLESLQGYLGDVRLAGQQPDVRSSLDRFERSREDLKRNNASPQSNCSVYKHLHIFRSYCDNVEGGEGVLRTPLPKSTYVK